MLLEHFGDNRNSGVDRVRNDKDERLGGEICDPSRKVLHNPAVDLERRQSDREDPTDRM
jgi:hypothetical protein